MAINLKKFQPIDGVRFFQLCCVCVSVCAIQLAREQGPSHWGCLWWSSATSACSLLYYRSNVTPQCSYPPLILLPLFFLLFILLLGVELNPKRSLAQATKALSRGSHYIWQLAPFYEDTDSGRAATHQLYSFSMEFWFSPISNCMFTNPCAGLVHQTIRFFF